MAVTIKSRETLYNVAEAAGKLRLRPRTIHQYVFRGLLTPTVREAGIVLFAESELARYQRERRSPGHPKTR